jgi:hypothetical protein
VSGYYTGTYDPNIGPDTKPRPNKVVPLADKLPSIDNMTEEEFTSIVDMATCLRSDFPMFLESMELVIKEQTRKALFDEIVTQEIIPDLQVVFIGAELTTLHCLWGRLSLEKQYGDAVAQERHTRPIRFVTIEGANHFVSQSDIDL